MPEERADNLLTDPKKAADLFAQSVAIMARLRAPGGCPWDREQSFDTIRKYTLEEAYEVFDAIERRDFPHLAEELGDLLLQVLFYAEMAANDGHFTISDVLNHLNRKLIRRHPHVFGEEASRAAGNEAVVDAAVEGSAARVLRNWEEIKAAEKAQTNAEADVSKSRLDSVQRAMPALAEAAKLGSKASNPVLIGLIGATCCPSSWRRRRNSKLKLQLQRTRKTRQIRLASKLNSATCFLPS